MSRRVTTFLRNILVIGKDKADDGRHEVPAAHSDGNDPDGAGSGYKEPLWVREVGCFAGMVAQPLILDQVQNTEEGIHNQVDDDEKDGAGL